MILVAMLLVLLLILDVRILRSLERRSRLNSHRLAVGLSAWGAMVSFVGVVAYEPLSTRSVVFGTVLAVTAFAVGYPLARWAFKSY